MELESLFLGDGTYIWFDGTNIYSIDETNKIANRLSSNENVGVVNKESFASLYPGYVESFFGRLMLAGNFATEMKTKNYNGNKCIVITIKEKEYTKTYWITKDFGELVQAKIEFVNGDIYEYKYDIKFHVTKLKDIELPDFSEYTVINSTTAEKVETDTLENDVKLQTQNVIVENVITDVIANPVS